MSAPFERIRTYPGGSCYVLYLAREEEKHHNLQEQQGKPFPEPSAIDLKKEVSKVQIELLKNLEELENGFEASYSVYST